MIPMDFSSDVLLLSTKLKMPTPRKKYVVRGALFEKLTQCVDMSVIFLCGGAGTGKTTVLSSFIHETSLSNICWVSLDATNTNVYSFWLYFFAAVSTFFEDGEGLLDLIRSTPDASHMEGLLTLLANRLYSSEDYYLVLDDVHYIGDSSLVRTLEFFINAMPSNFHIFMLSREDPPIYLGPLAMSGRLLYIDGKQLQLTPEEGMSFLKNTLQLTAGDEELTRLNTYADGWIGGLQLAAAAGMVGKHSKELLRAGGGIAAEYLNREIYKALALEEQEFLIGTGFLSYFNTDICSALFEGMTKTDYDRMIDALIGKNLFIVCVDEIAGVYRYHNILSDYLMHQFQLLSEEHKKRLYLKAADAFEKQGDCGEALREFCAAEDYVHILRVARKMGGRIESWVYLDKVPAELLIEDPDLAAQCLMYHLGNLNIDRCRILLEEFRQHYGESDIFRAIQFAETYLLSDDAILPQYHVLTAEQIEHIPFGSVAKAMILVQNSAALVARMQYEEAESCIKAAIRICAGANIFVDLFAYNQLAQVYEETGRLKDSLSCYDKAREYLKEPLMLSGVGTNYYFGLVGVYMRRMELDKAETTLYEAKRLLETLHLHVDITDLTLLHHEAELKFLTGDEEAGTAYVEEILTEYPAFSVLTLARPIHELECAGRLPQDLADEFLKELEAAQDYRDQPYMRLLRARLLFKQGKTALALQETEEVLSFSRLRKNRLRLVEAGLQKIVILVPNEGLETRYREIMNLLREAIHYAQADRILMPFYLDHTPLLPLLQQLSTQATGKNALTEAEEAFLQQALIVCGYSAPSVKDAGSLSARELEVLTELSLGITNREIAEKLCISQATVKTHVLSIYGKLGVSSRMLAVQEGRIKGLIQT